MAKGLPAYQLTAYKHNYEALALVYDCTGIQIFNLFKRLKKDYTNHINKVSRSGAEAVQMDKLSPILKKSIEVFSSDGKRVQSKNRPTIIKRQSVSIIYFLILLLHMLLYTGIFLFRYLHIKQLFMVYL